MVQMECIFETGRWKLSANFGESKMYKDIKDAFDKALKSLYEFKMKLMKGCV